MAEVLGDEGLEYEDDAERKLRLLLEGELPEDWIVYPQFRIASLAANRLEAADRTMDFLVVGRNRVFVLEAKAWSGRWAGDVNHWERKDPAPGREESRRTPFKQVKTYVDFVVGHLQRLLPGEARPWVAGLVVLCGQTRKQDLEGVEDPMLPTRVFNLEEVCHELLRQDQADGTTLAPETRRRVVESLRRFVPRTVPPDPGLQAWFDDNLQLFKEDAERYYPRSELDKLLRRHRALVEGGWLVVTGAPGVGKSILAAAAVETLSREPGHRVVPLRLGSGASLDKLWRVLLHQLQRLGGFRLPRDLRDAGPSSPEALSAALRRFAEARAGEEGSPSPASLRCPGLTVLLDGLDEMEAPVRLLDVLPRAVPPGVRMLLFSWALPEVEVFLQGVTSRTERLALGVMAPAEAAGLLERDFELHSSEDRTRRILERAEGHPMLLRLLGKCQLALPLAESEGRGDEGVEAYLRRIIRPVVQGRAPATPGAALRERLLPFLLEARSPLSSRALREIMSAIAPEVQAGQVSEALRDLAPLLQARPAGLAGSTGYRVFHRQVELLLREDLLPATRPTAIQAVHNGFCRWLKCDTEASRAYGLRHHPEHLWQAGHPEEAVRLLCSAEFLVRRRAHGLYFQTFQDLQDMEQRLAALDHQEDPHRQAREEFSAGLVAWAEHFRAAASRGVAPWEVARQAPSIPFPDSRALLQPSGLPREKRTAAGAKGSHHGRKARQGSRYQEALARLRGMRQSLSRFAPYQALEGLDLASYLADFCDDKKVCSEARALRQASLKVDWDWPAAWQEADRTRPASIMVGGEIKDLALTADGRWAAVLTETQALALFDLDSGEMVVRIPVPGAAQATIGSARGTVQVSADGRRLLTRWNSTAALFRWAPGEPLERLWTGSVDSKSVLRMDESGVLLMTDAEQALEGLPAGFRETRHESLRAVLRRGGLVPFDFGRGIFLLERAADIAPDGKERLVLCELRFAGPPRRRDLGEMPLDSEEGLTTCFSHRGQTTVVPVTNGDEVFLTCWKGGRMVRRAAPLGTENYIEDLEISGDERHCLVARCQGGLDVGVELWTLPDLERVASCDIPSIRWGSDNITAVDGHRIVCRDGGHLLIYDLFQLFGLPPHGDRPAPGWVACAPGPCFLAPMDAPRGPAAVVEPAARRVISVPVMDDEGGVYPQVRVAFHGPSECLAVVQILNGREYWDDHYRHHWACVGLRKQDGEGSSPPPERPPFEVHALSGITVYRVPDMTVLGTGTFTGEVSALKHHPTEPGFLAQVTDWSDEGEDSLYEVVLDYQGCVQETRLVINRCVSLLLSECSEDRELVDSAAGVDLLVRNASPDPPGDLKEFIARYRDGSEWTVASLHWSDVELQQPTLADDGRVLFACRSGRLLEVDLPGRTVLSDELVIGASYRLGRLHPRRHQAALLRTDGTLELRDLDRQKTLALFTAGEEIVEVADFLPDDRLACLTSSRRVLVLKPHRL